MNWSAFFSGAPGGFEQGMGAAQKYQQGQQQYQHNQQMNPLQQQHQQLQNSQMQQNISQGATNYNRQGNAFAMQPPQGGGGGMPNMDNILGGPQAHTGGVGGPGMQTFRPGSTDGPQNFGQYSPGQILGRPVQGNYSPGEGQSMTPTAQPMQGGQQGPDNIFSQLGTYPQQDFSQLYQNRGPGMSMGYGPQQPYQGQGGNLNAPWANRGGWQ